MSRQRYHHRGCAPVRQAPAQTQQEKGQGTKPGSPKAGRGQVGLFWLLYIIQKASSAYLLCICSFVYDAVSPTATMKDHILMPTTLLHQACAWRLPMIALPQPYKDNNQTTPKLSMRCKHFDPKQSGAQPSNQQLATYLQFSGTLCMLLHVWWREHGVLGCHSCWWIFQVSIDADYILDAGRAAEILPPGFVQAASKQWLWSDSLHL